MNKKEVEKNFEPWGNDDNDIDWWMCKKCRDVTDEPKRHVCRVDGRLIYKHDLLMWAVDHADVDRRVSVHEMIEAIREGSFDEILPMWRSAVPYIRESLDFIARDPRWANLTYTNKDIERICAYIAEESDPLNLRGIALRSKILKGLEEGAW